MKVRPELKLAQANLDGVLKEVSITERDLGKMLYLTTGPSSPYMKVHSDVHKEWSNDDLSYFVECLQDNLDKAYEDGVASVRSSLMRALGFGVINQDNYAQADNVEVVVLRNS